MIGLRFERIMTDSSWTVSCLNEEGVSHYLQQFEWSLSQTTIPDEEDGAAQTTVLSSVGSTQGAPHGPANASPEDLTDEDRTSWQRDIKDTEARGT